MGPCSRPAGTACAVGHVHRDVAALLDVAHRDARLGQRPLEGEAAPDEERHQVVAPVRDDVRGLVHQLAVLPDPVARQVGAQVGAVGERQWSRSRRR